MFCFSTKIFHTRAPLLPVILYNNAFGLHAEYAKGVPKEKRLTFAKTITLVHTSAYLQQIFCFSLVEKFGTGDHQGELCSYIIF